MDNEGKKNVIEYITDSCDVKICSTAIHTQMNFCIIHSLSNTSIQSFLLLYKLLFKEL